MTTRASLLLRIRDPNDAVAWSEFVRLYAPLLHAYGMKNGLQDADAADLSQDTLRSVLRAVPGFVYDPARGSFRGWLLAIARNGLRKRAARQARVAVGSGDTDIQDLLEAHPAAAAEHDEWDREYQLNLFRWAAERVKVEFREKTWLAFWRTVVVGDDIGAVAADLGVTTGAVYVARCRVAARIRDEIRSVEGGEP
jgi:RNA polymerase sigma-70 factor (ECF subfamily)